MTYKRFIYILMAVPIILSSCSTTSSLKNNEKLFIGLEKIEYTNYEPCAHQAETQEELEAALATQPNGSLFGSSYYRTPFPYGLWLWNAFSGHNGIFAKWVMNSFAKAPVLMSNVNPKLRASIAKTVLENNGYFQGYVKHSVIDGKPMTTKSDTIERPRTAKIKYEVNFGQLYTIDSMSYTNYPKEMLKFIDTDEKLINPGDPFSVAKLDNERQRIQKLLHNHGYYYYQASNSSYLADTLQTPGKVQLQLHLADSLPDDDMRKWVIGKVNVQIRETAREQLTDSTSFRYLTLRFKGQKPPVRPGVILADMKMRPGDIFSQEAYQESLNNLISKGIFSTTEITFKPRRDAEGKTILVPDSVTSKNGEDRANAGVMDMTINTVLDKPYDLTFKIDASGKTNGRLGPGLSLGLAKRNTFRGGELFSASIGANYEFQTGGAVETGNSFDLSINTSLQTPRVLFRNLLFKRKRRRWFTTPATTFAISGEALRRASFFTRYVLAADMTYTMQPSASSVHSFSPINITYGHNTKQSEAYLNKIATSGYALMSSQDELTVKMRYRYIYSSPERYRNPIYWETTVTEAGNMLNGIYTLIGNKWSKKRKELCYTPFSQFLKLETELTKKWTLSNNNTLVARAYGGVIWSYGNSDNAPFSEMLYISGSNDLRGFSMRSIGPGSYHNNDNNLAYIYHNGDVKAVMNLEYRAHIIGSLYGALFLDAGNVWSLSGKSSLNEDLYKTTEDATKATGNPKKLDLGIDVGAGLRYDMDYFVLRLDWGFAIHSPYDTGHPGFFNINKFKDAQCINFAIGYPF